MTSMLAEAIRAALVKSLLPRAVYADPVAVGPKGRTAGPPPGALELPEAYGAVLFDRLAKGAGHKYLKRVPTGKVTKTGKPKYRYYYHVGSGGGVHAHEHMIEGASFRHEGGHWHIERADGDTLHIRHDESGDAKTVSRAELSGMLLHEHGAALEAYRAKIAEDWKDAHENGASPKQRARIAQRAGRVGATLPPTPSTKEKTDEHTEGGGKPRGPGGPRVLDPDAERTGRDRRDHEGPREPSGRRGEEGPAEQHGAEATLSPYLTAPAPTEAWKPVESPAVMLHADLAPTPTAKLPEPLKVFPRPKGKATQLFPHQIDGAERVLSAFERGDGAIVSDDAGLGKTNTAMATIVAHGADRNLVVVPTAGKAGIKKQWRDTAALYGLQVFDGPPSSAEQKGIFLVSYDELVGRSEDAIANVQRWKEQLEEAVALRRSRRPTETWEEALRHEEELRSTRESIRAYARAEDLEDALDAALEGKKVRVPPSLHERLRDGFGLVVFDEAHNLANADGQRAKVALDLQDRTKKALYLSATPFTNVADMHYLTKLGLFSDRESFLKWAQDAGANVNGNAVKNPSSVLPLAAISATLHVDGKMIKRSANLKGLASAFVVLDGKAGGANPADHPDAKATFAGADRVFNAAADAGVLGDSMLEAFRTAWARQYWETLKVPDAIEAGKKALAAGKQVAFFTSYKGADHTHLRALAGIARRKAERAAANDDHDRAAQFEGVARAIDATIDRMPKVEPAIARLVAAFGGPGAVAEIHGDTKKRPEEEQEAYQAGKKRVVVATMARGGTGISLHDDRGNAPRAQINLSLPWSGREFNQVAGRSHRLGSQSGTVMHWLVGDDPTEKHNGAMVAKRLKTMGALTTGDPETTADARHLANWEFGSALDVDIDAKAIERAALEAEGDTRPAEGASEEAVAARDYFREYALRRKGGSDVIGEEGKRRAEERERRIHSEARRAIAKLATAHPVALEARRYSNGQYGLDASLKSAAERIAGKVPGRTGWSNAAGKHLWFLDAEKIPDVVEKMGLHRAQHDPAHVRQLAERHARVAPAHEGLTGPTESPTQASVAHTAAAVTATPRSPHEAAVHAAGLLTRSTVPGYVHLTGNTYKHKEAIKAAAQQAGARAQWIDGGWSVPESALQHLAGKLRKGLRWFDTVMKGADFAKPPGSGWEPIPGSHAGGYRKRAGARFEYWYPSAHHALADHVFAGRLHATGRAEHAGQEQVGSAAAGYLHQSHKLDGAAVKHLAGSSRIAVSDDGKRLTGISTQHGRQWRTVHALGERFAHHVENTRGDVGPDTLDEKVTAYHAERKAKGWQDPGAVALEGHLGPKPTPERDPKTTLNALARHAKTTGNTALAHALALAMTALTNPSGAPAKPAAQQPPAAQQSKPAEAEEPRTLGPEEKKAASALLFALEVGTLGPGTAKAKTEAKRLRALAGAPATPPDQWTPEHWKAIEKRLVEVGRAV